MTLEQTSKMMTIQLGGKGRAAGRNATINQARTTTPSNLFLAKKAFQEGFAAGIKKEDGLPL